MNGLVKHYCGNSGLVHWFLNVLVSNKAIPRTGPTRPTILRAATHIQSRETMPSVSAGLIILTLTQSVGSVDQTHDPPDRSCSPLLRQTYLRVLFGFSSEILYICIHVEIISATVMMSINNICCFLSSLFL